MNETALTQPNWTLGEPFNLMKICYHLNAIIQEKMWGEDNIDDTLKKLKFEDAFKEICQNQEKLSQIRDPKVVNHYKWALEQKTLEKRRFADCNLVFRPSLRSSLTPVIIPASSQNVSLPSSNHSNSTTVEKIACFGLVSPNDQYSSNTMNNKDTPTDFSCHPCRAQFLWFHSFSFH